MCVCARVLVCSCVCVRARACVRVCVCVQQWEGSAGEDEGSSAGGVREEIVEADEAAVDAPALVSVAATGLVHSSLHHPAPMNGKHAHVFISFCTCM